MALAISRSIQIVPLRITLFCYNWTIEIDFVIYAFWISNLKTFKLISKITTFSQCKTNLWKHRSQDFFEILSNSLSSHLSPSTPTPRKSVKYNLSSYHRFSWMKLSRWMRRVSVKRLIFGNEGARFGQDGAEGDPLDEHRGYFQAPQRGREMRFQLVIRQPVVNVFIHVSMWNMIARVGWQLHRGKKKKEEEFASSVRMSQNEARASNEIGSEKGLCEVLFHRGKIHEDGAVFSTKTDYLLLRLACIDSAYGEERFDQLVSVARCTVWIMSRPMVGSVFSLFVFWNLLYRHFLFWYYNWWNRIRRLEILWIFCWCLFCLNI